MRILVATDQWFPEVEAGPARLASDVSQGLCDRGHDVTVLAPRNGSLVTSREGDVKVHRFLARNALPKTVTDPVETWRHARGLDAEFDVLLAHESTTAVGLFAQAKKAPLVLMFHASAAREQRFLRSRLHFGPKKLTTYALAPSLQFLERRAVESAERILVLSDFSRSLVHADHDVPDSAITTVPGLVDTERFSPGDGRDAARGRLGLDPERELLLTVRRLEPRMGIDRLLNALPLLAEKRATLVVAGAGSLSQELVALAQSLGVADRVRFLGRVAQDEVLVDWYRAADLFVLPTTAYEGFGMATAEALACGTPVVGTPVGATPELLMPIDPRLISASADPEDLALAIDSALELATDPALAGRCRSSAVERFSPERAAIVWERALEEACR